MSYIHYPVIQYAWHLGRALLFNTSLLSKISWHHVAVELSSQILHLDIPVGHLAPLHSPIHCFCAANTWQESMRALLLLPAAAGVGI